MACQAIPGTCAGQGPAAEFAHLPELSVRDRDTVGFVEEARRLVSEKVKLPAGMYLE